MPVPTSIDDLSTTASSNSPAGSEGPASGDDYLRALSAFIAELRDKLDGTSSTGTLTSPTVNAATFTGTHTFSSGNLIAGTYTPTLTGGTNVSSTSATVCTYIRVGAVVTVGGAITVKPTSAGGCDVGVSLPVASNFSGTTQLGGTGVITSGYAPLFFIADTINDRAAGSFTASAGGSFLTIPFTFQYQVI